MYMLKSNIRIIITYSYTEHNVTGSWDVQNLKDGNIHVSRENDASLGKSFWTNHRHVTR